jgi:hypothetical protein
MFAHAQVWKLLCQDTPTEDDLAAVDLMVVESMQKFRDVDQLGIDRDSFNDIFMETFSTTSVDGRCVPLARGVLSVAVFG